MKKNDYLANILLAALVALTALGFALAKLFYPMVVLPAWNIPNLVILCTAALVAAESLAPGRKSVWWLSALLAAVSFGLLPAAAGVTAWAQSWKLLLAGGLVFLGCSGLLRSAVDRLSSGPAGRLAPVSVGLTICLLGQIFSGMFL